MKSTRRAPAAALLTVLAAGATGCGAILEEAAEEALEQEGVEVEFDDLEDGEFTINIEDENGEGTFTVDAEGGQLEFENEDGSGTLTTDTELPADWPNGYPLPDGAGILSTGRFEEGDSVSYVAAIEGPAGSFDAYLAHFQGIGQPVLNQSDFSGDGAQQATITWGTDDAETGTVLITGDESGVYAQLTVLG